jgi:aryl-alcohol dehydrogenase
METQAAVINEASGAFEIETLELDDPQEGEVLVRVVGAGICHTDISVRDQFKSVPLPAVLGHEGSGVVEAVGPGVTEVEPGDHVVMTFDFDETCKNCRRGEIAYCDGFYDYNFGGERVSDGTSPLSRDGERVSGMFFGQSSFATHAIATERNVVAVPESAPLELLGPLGCGIQTGAGGVMNACEPEAGSSIVVFGAGSVGLSAVMAANLEACTEIVAVDLVESRLETALELGATHAVNADQVDDVEDAVRDYLGGGADYTLETTAQPDVLRTAVDTTRKKGHCGIIGAPRLGTEVTLDVNTLLRGRSVAGILMGSTVPKEFIPTLVKLHEQGRFPMDEIVTYYPFEEIQQAVHDHESGETIKPIVRMSEP